MANVNSGSVGVAGLVWGLGDAWPFAMASDLSVKPLTKIKESIDYQGRVVHRRIYDSGLEVTFNCTYLSGSDYPVVGDIISLPLDAHGFITGSTTKFHVTDMQPKYKNDDNLTVSVTAIKNAQITL